MRCLLFLCLGWACVAQGAARRIPDPPPVPREFRGVWSASVGNIDWPSQPGAPVARQQADLRALLDMAVRVRLNVVILQVRPSSDALYASSLEPWSEYLTGRMGQAPNPRWDPLEFACAEAHARGLELHAWINPFRARYFKTLSRPSADHVTQRNPRWVVPFGNLLWVDPGVPEAREHVLQVALDIVERYDVDGFHVDDYFYPYPIRLPDGTWQPFFDGASYGRYRSEGGRLELGDWRRDNVNQFVASLYERIHKAKPWVKVGISPFGIWRPGFPPGIKGLDQYLMLHADARLWLNQGWCDYLAPQLYWPLGRPEQNFQGLLRWWEQENRQSRLLTPGLNSAKIGDDRRVGDTLSQIRILRQDGAEGEVFWNASSLLRNFGGLAVALPQDLFARPALVPPTPWLKVPAPDRPELAVERPRSDVVSVGWQSPTNTPISAFVLQQRVALQWRSEILLPSVTNRVFDRRRGIVLPEEVRIVPVNRAGVEGAPAVWRGE
ncbi:MAG: family 10 glycosylhydrolase [Verrucomicrobia bacterium]|nr:family 10 glycosylhydrolase [Verrucomicrobiota bacterium]